MTTQPSGTVPIYRRIARTLANRIRKGELPPGSRVLPERDLAAEYGVSRMTARAAVQLLAQRGLVESKDRSGVFVAPAKIEQELHTVAGFYDQMISRGIAPGAEVIGARTVAAEELDAEVALNLELGDEDLVHELIRSRTGDGEVLALEESYYPASLLPGLLEEDLSKSVYGLFSDLYARKPARFRQEISPTQLDAEYAAMLGTRPDVCVLRIVRVAWDDTDRPVEYATDLYRGDRLVFVAETSASH